MVCVNWDSHLLSQIVNSQDGLLTQPVPTVESARYGYRGWSGVPLFSFRFPTLGITRKLLFGLGPTHTVWGKCLLTLGHEEYVEIVILLALTFSCALTYGCSRSLCHPHVHFRVIGSAFSLRHPCATTTWCACGKSVP